MKKIMLFVLVLGVAFLTTSCSEATITTTEDESSSDEGFNIRINLEMPTKEAETEFSQYDLESIVEDSTFSTIIEENEPTAQPKEIVPEIISEVNVTELETQEPTDAEITTEIAIQEPTEKSSEKMIYAIVVRDTEIITSDGMVVLKKGQKVRVFAIGDDTHEIEWYGSKAYVNAEHIEVFDESYQPVFEKGSWAGCIT